MSKQEEIQERIDRILFALEAGEISVFEAKQRLSATGCVLKVDRDKNNKYLLAEFYTSKMPTAVDGPNIDCGFFEPLIDKGEK